MIYYIADMHFDHTNIIKHSKRPYTDAESMNEDFITRWNKKVSNNDDVYIVGDVSYKSGRSASEFLNRLNGKKHLIVGNHDKALMRDKDAVACFVDRPRDMATIQDGDKTIVLCHYPMVEWDGYWGKGAIHIYGHIHNNTKNLTYDLLRQIPNCYNAGTDIIGFEPCTVQEIIDRNNAFDKANATVVKETTTGIIIGNQIVVPYQTNDCVIVNNTTYTFCACSRCNEEFLFSKKMKFCPNCGSRIASNN